MLALFGFLVALFLAIIGYLQWCIAYQRIILDLFQRRFQTYDELRSVIFTYAQGLQVSNKELGDFTRAEGKAKFLFGDEVVDYLSDRYNDLVTVNVFRGLPPVPTAECQEQQKEVHEADKRLVKVPIELEKRMMPYMRMSQTMRSAWLPDLGIKKPRWMGG